MLFSKVYSSNVVTSHNFEKLSFLIHLSLIWRVLEPSRFWQTTWLCIKAAGLNRVGLRFEARRLCSKSPWNGTVQYLLRHSEPFAAGESPSRCDSILYTKQCKQFHFFFVTTIFGLVKVKKFFDTWISQRMILFKGTGSLNGYGFCETCMVRSWPK